MEHGPPLGIHLNAGKTELLMGKHGFYDAAYSFFEVLTNPEGPYRLQPERVRFHPNEEMMMMMMMMMMITYDDNDDYIQYTVQLLSD